MPLLATAQNLKQTQPRPPWPPPFLPRPPRVAAGLVWLVATASLPPGLSILDTARNDEARRLRRRGRRGGRAARATVHVVPAGELQDGRGAGHGGPQHRRGRGRQGGILAGRRAAPRRGRARRLDGTCTPANARIMPLDPYLCFRVPAPVA